MQPNCSPKTINTLAFEQNVENAGNLTIVKFAPQMVKNEITGITGHFAKKCRKPKKSRSQKSKHPQTNVNQIDTNTTKGDDEISVHYIASYQQLYDLVDDSNYDSDSDDYLAAISSDSENQLESLNAKTKLGNILESSFIDSGSVCCLITKTIANRILKTLQLQNGSPRSKTMT